MTLTTSRTITITITRRVSNKGFVVDTGLLTFVFETNSCCSVLYSIDPRSRKSGNQNKHKTSVEFGCDVQVAFDSYVSCVFAWILMNARVLIMDIMEQRH